jgi:hypothetical protein
MTYPMAIQLPKAAHPNTPGSGPEAEPPTLFGHVRREVPRALFGLAGQAIGDADFRYSGFQPGRQAFGQRFRVPLERDSDAVRVDHGACVYLG